MKILTLVVVALWQGLPTGIDPKPQLDALERLLTAELTEFEAVGKKHTLIGIREADADATPLYRHAIELTDAALEKAYEQDEDWSLYAALTEWVRTGRDLPDSAAAFVTDTKQAIVLARRAVHCGRMGTINGPSIGPFDDGVRSKQLVLLLCAAAVLEQARDPDTALTLLVETCQAAADLTGREPNGRWILSRLLRDVLAAFVATGRVPPGREVELLGVLKRFLQPRPAPADFVREEGLRLQVGLRQLLAGTPTKRQVRRSYADWSEVAKRDGKPRSRNAVLVVWRKARRDIRRILDALSKETLESAAETRWELLLETDARLTRHVLALSIDMQMWIHGRRDWLTAHLATAVLKAKRRTGDWPADAESAMKALPKELRVELEGLRLERDGEGRTVIRGGGYGIAVETPDGAEEEDESLLFRFRID